MASPFPGFHVEVAAIQRSIECWNRRDLEGFLTCLTEDVYWDDPPMPEPARNKQEVRRWAQTAMNAFPDMTFTVRHIFAGPEHKYAVNWTVSATFAGRFDPPGFAPTNRHAEFDGIDLIEFRDGKMYRIETFLDGMKLSINFGLMPPRPKPGSFWEWTSVRLQHAVAWFLRR